MSSGSCFSSVLLLPEFFLCMWVAFFFKSPSTLFWVFALQLLVEKIIIFDCTIVYLSLYTILSWFCSFHSASVTGDYSTSMEFLQFIIPLSTVVFYHQHIPQFVQPFPNWRTYPHFPGFFATTKSLDINIFVQVFFPMISLGHKPSSGMAGSKGRQFFSTLGIVPNCHPEWLGQFTTPPAMN